VRLAHGISYFRVQNGLDCGKILHSFSFQTGD
jgi:hypothetical protein